MQSSTIRSALDPTIAGQTTDDGLTVVAEAVLTRWEQSGEPDMVITLREHPELLGKRSLLLNLAITEYKARRRVSGDVDLARYCDRFAEFGSSVHRSIHRQLEVQRSLEEQPEIWGDLSTTKWPEAGEKFAGFCVLEELGRGATARVYLCLEASVGNRPVVVKASPFPSIEASILGQLNHANIIPIHSTEFADDFGLHYVCMPYRGRSTLLDLLDQAFVERCPRTDQCIAIAADRWTANDQRLPRERKQLFVGRLRYGTFVDGILKLAIQMAEALDHAHQKGILHGDLKPSNVLLTPSGMPLLLDFNLSRDYARMPSVCGGTLPYMPPEHLKIVAGDLPHAENDQSGVASDVYSYGALLYELLTGAVPACKQADVSDPSTTAKLLLTTIQQGIRPLRERNPFVSRRLESIVLRCLAVNPNARPATMSKVKLALFGEMRSLAAVGRKARVRPVLFAAALGLPLAVVTAGITYWSLQPPQYLVDYERGTQLAVEGKPAMAAEHLLSAVGYNPSFAPARFELGRARLALGEVDLATNEFGALAQAENDPHSMAYLAYCFNLKRVSVAAIPWYERAIDRGARSAAVYNNLGASYLAASSHVSAQEKLRRAEANLRRAWELSQTSSIVQLNIVRHAVAKSQLDSEYKPFEVWRFVEQIVAKSANDRFIETHVAIWYHAVLHFEMTHPDVKWKSTARALNKETSLRQRVSQIYAKVRTSNADFPFSFEAHSQPSLPVDRYYLEPVSLDGRHGAANHSH